MSRRRNMMMMAETDPYAAETRMFKAAVRRNGGDVSDARMSIIDTFVRAEKTSGAWGLTDDYWVFWAESAIQALTSLKQGRLATVVNAPTFTADRDYVLDGATNYINTGFIPSTHGISYTGASQRVGVYERTNVSSTGIAVGVSDTNAAGPKIRINPRDGSNIVAALNNANAIPITFALTLADSRGLKSVRRAAGSTTGVAYDRGVRLTDATSLTVGTAAATRALFIGCSNNIGTAASFRAGSIGMAVIGGAMSDAQELAQYNAVQAFATSVGANV